MSLTSDCSPACILSFLLTAIHRGELKQVWQWKDEPEQKKSEDQDLKVLEPIKPEQVEQAQDRLLTQTDVSAVDGSATGSDHLAEDGDEANDIGSEKPKKKRQSKKRRG